MDKVIDRLLVVLNRAIKADPRAMEALLSIRIPCNQALADDPDIPVLQPKGERATVSMLGLVCGFSGYNAERLMTNMAANYEVVCPAHGVVEGRVGGQCPQCKHRLDLGRLLGFEDQRKKSADAD